MSQEAAKGVRTPGPVPNIVSHARTAREAVERLPASIREAMLAVLTPLLAVAKEQDTFNRRQRARYGSLPSPHADSHLPSGGDPLATGTPVSVTTTNSEGSAESFARSDHIHRLGIVSAKGQLIGHNGTDPVAVPAGSTDGYLLTREAAAASGMSWQAPADDSEWLAIIGG